MRYLLAMVMALALTGCASTVVTDYNDSVVFGNYATWAFAPDAGEDAFVSLDGSRVRQAVERQLKRKAMRQVPAAEADLLVTWRIVEEERLEQSGVGLGVGFGRGNFGWGISAPPPIRTVEEGKLVVEMVDPKLEQVVWRAASRRYLRESQSPESRRALIDEVVADMFSEYPPGVN